MRLPSFLDCRRKYRIAYEKLDPWLRYPKKIKIKIVYRARQKKEIVEKIRRRRRTIDFGGGERGDGEEIAEKLKGIIVRVSVQTISGASLQRNIHIPFIFHFFFKLFYFQHPPPFSDIIY